MNRRDLLRSSAWLALGYPIRHLSAFTPAPQFTADPFSMSVASGDPTRDGIVLWTRLLPDPGKSQAWEREAVSVDWQIATDENMKNVVLKGKETARPDYGHSVHAEVKGLQPNRWYWYRFRTSSAESVIGRTRTAPASPTDKIKFAFASCQQFHAGYYTPYAHMAKDDIDVVLFLGDYIYESAGGTGDRQVEGPEPMTRDDYRKRYAIYRSDKNLREVHRLFPWIITWDDHEVDNNYAGDAAQDQQTKGDFIERRAGAYQAHYEWMPLPKTVIPVNGHSRLYRRVSFGPMLNFFVLDGRQFRSDQPCGDGTKAPCAEFRDDNRTMLGAEQERWLDQQMQSSKAQWNVLANQARMTFVDNAPGPDEMYSMDSWTGYDAARRRLISSMRDRKLSNPVVITGDIHSNWVGDLKVDYQDPKSPIVGTEFVGTSITSGGDGMDMNPQTERYLPDNPWVRFFNAQRGYVRCEVTKSSITADYRVVEKVSTPESPISTRAKFIAESGRPGAQKI